MCGGGRGWGVCVGGGGGGGDIKRDRNRSNAELAMLYMCLGVYSTNVRWNPSLKTIVIMYSFMRYFSRFEHMAHYKAKNKQSKHT